VLTNNTLHLHVGGGIVADSTPDRELEETEEKAAAWGDVVKFFGFRQPPHDSG
jgi:anthranilate/para-aminobenzoate synthase component I